MKPDATVSHTILDEIERMLCIRSSERFLLPGIVADSMQLFQQFTAL